MLVTLTCNGLVTILKYISKVSVLVSYLANISRFKKRSEEDMTKLGSVLNSRDITLPTKVCLVKAMVFSTGRVWIWELDYKESWDPKNWCFWTVVLEKTLESPLDSKEIKPVNPKGNQPWIFTGRTDAEAEAPVLWPPDVRSQLTGEDPDAGKDWGQKKGAAEDEMVRRHHRLNSQKFEQTLGDSGRQRSLAC